MKKSSVYTRSGDEGKTSLVSGERLAKSDFRIDLYGDVDELNSYYGLILSLYNKSNIELNGFSELSEKVQCNLFNLGSFLACEQSSWEKYKLPKVEEELVQSLEALIDEMDVKLVKLKNFVLPGGSEISSHCHIARCICRRVERKLVEYYRQYKVVPEGSLELLNRLSDFLFVMARLFNLELKHDELLWKPNK